MILEASKHGDVIVVANSDDWLFRKKGFTFMEFEQRAEILAAVKGVIKVSGVDDSDGTVCEAIMRLKPDYFANGGDRKKHNTPEQSVCDELGVDYFANGGDRKKHNTPEQSVCDELGVEMLWGIGGNNKANSSSDLVERVKVTRKVSDK
jgi:glycerol-3-phosphate cytidylyltransferase-like family protein